MTLLIKQFLTDEEKEALVIDLMKWKKCYNGKSIQERFKTATLALSECRPQTFPTLHKLFTIFLTIPVGVSCERSFSALCCGHILLWKKNG